MPRPDPVAAVRLEIEELAKLMPEIPKDRALAWVDRHPGEVNDLYNNGMRISELADFVLIGA